MRQIIPIIRTFRDQLTKFPLLANQNWIYRRAVLLLEKLYCLSTCADEVLTDQFTINTSLSILRFPDPMAKKTTISNIGASGTATIFEEGKIVALIAPGESRELQLSGRFLIESKCESGSTTLVVTTHRRCQCGDDYIAPYGQAVEPIGGDLI